MLQPKISSFKNIGQQKVGSKSLNHCANLQTTMCKTNIQIWDCFNITVSETVITKIQRVQNSFIRIAIRLPKYVSAHLLHEAQGL